MIANDAFVGCFGIVPAADEEALPALVRNAVRHGFAVVPVVPGGKEPVCVLTVRQAKAADREAQAAAKMAGRGNWDRARHPCSLNHAMTDAEQAARVVRRLARDRGAINLGVEVGRSRMVLVDLDTADELAGFLADWSAATGQDMTGRRPTVTTPGLRKVGTDSEERWLHKDGGHFWFTVPDDVDLAGLPGEGALRAESGWTVYWRDRQALVPPSVRPEGAYAITGQSEPCPVWLVERIRAHAAAYAQRKAERADRVRFDDDPIDAWSSTTAWAELLDPDGWTETGQQDACGCPTWTRPGEPAHSKSATAHEDGCVRYDTDAGHGPLHVWSDNPPAFLADAVASTGSRTLTKLQYVAWRDHDGDTAAAMRALGLDFLGGDQEQAEVDAMLDGAPDPVGPDRDPDGVPPEGPTGDSIPDELAELRGNRPLLREVLQLHRREQARDWYERFRGRAGRADLRARIQGATDRLSTAPDDEDDIAWRIEELWQQGQTVLLTAQYKAGKTTMVLNVIRSLVDGKPFLGQFKTVATARNVYVVNAEMTGRQFRRWLREAGIGNRDKVFALHLRDAGPAAGNLLDPTVRDALVEALIEADAQVLILDPLNPMLSAAGVDENASSEVARWFNALTDLVERSGVDEVFLVHHFGHNGERGRGSSKFMDAPDAIWTYTKEKAKETTNDVGDDELLGEIDAASEPRYLAAIGRDVDLVKSRVEFDEHTRSLTMPLVGNGPQQAEKKRVALTRDRLIGHITSFVLAHPGITFKALYDLVKGKTDAFRAAVNEAVARGVLIESRGPNRSRAFTAAHVGGTGGTPGGTRWDPRSGSRSGGWDPRHPVGGPGPTTGPTENQDQSCQDHGPTQTVVSARGGEPP